MSKKLDYKIHKVMIEVRESDYQFCKQNGIQISPVMRNKLHNHCNKFRVIFEQEEDE